MDKDDGNKIGSFFDEQYSLYRDDIFKFCMARLRCDADMAEDCTQEAFLVLYNRLKSNEIIENPRAFLYKTASNYVKKAYAQKQKKIETEISIDNASPQILLSVNEIESRFDYEELQNMIDNILNEEDKKLFDMRFIQNMRVKDIAKILSITPTSCSTRLMRIRNRIKDEILKG